MSNDSQMQNIQCLKGGVAVQSANQLAMRRDVPGGIMDFSKAEQDPEELDYEQRFAIVLDAALDPELLPGSHYMTLTREMTRNDPQNFYTLAAETIVACLSKCLGRSFKYHLIYLHLGKARIAVDRCSSAQIEALEEVEKLVESVVDIFDY